MNSILVGPTGAVVRGSIWDTSKSALEEQLRSYDPRVTFKLTWNPKKNRGMGCWELWKRPNQKAAVPVGTFEGNTICMVDYVYDKHIHHVIDVPYLSPYLMRIIEERDVVRKMERLGLGFDEAVESLTKSAEEKAVLHKQKEIDYMVKQSSRFLYDLRDAALSGDLGRVVGKMGKA